jgi:aspartate/methionine/tyrosine aminotransferase
VYYNGWATLGDASFINIPLLPSNGFCLTAADIANVVSPKTKVLILNSPHNPTGQVFEQAEILKIAALAVKHDFIVIADDIYSHMLYDGIAHFNIARAPGMQERTITIGSFSKSYAMDGWRIGFLAAPRAFIPNMLKMQQHIISCPNSFVQYGALAALTSPQDCLHEMVDRFDHRRNLLISLLDDLGLPYARPRGAFYIFPDISKYGLTSMAFCERMLDEARIALVPGSAFGPPGEGYVRIAYSVSRAEIEIGMGRMAEVLKKLDAPGTPGSI